MKAIDWNQWRIANQQYVASAIGMLKEQLQWYVDHRQNDRSSQTSPDFEAAKEKLNALAGNMVAPPAIEQLAVVFGLSHFEKDIIVLCAGVELDAGLAALVQEIQRSPSPTFGLALGALREAHWSALAPTSTLRYWHLVEVNTGSLITSSALKIDEQMLHYLTGVGQLNERLINVVSQVTILEKPAPSQCSLAESVVYTVNQGNKLQGMPVIHFHGTDKADKLGMAAYISRRLDCRLFAMSAFSIPGGNKENARLARMWSREAALNNYVLFVDCNDIDTSDKARLQSIVYFLDSVQGLVIMNADYWTPALRRTRLMYEVAKPSADEQLSLWKSAIGHYSEQAPLALSRLVAQFNLSGDVIRKVGAEMTSELPLQTGVQRPAEEVNTKLWITCCRHTRPQVDELAQRVETIAHWGDIVLPEMQLSILRDIAAQVRQRNKVYHEWGFGAKSARGLGISALFSGESGTGKTMASEVLANELKLDLYKIDLSKVVNKYIGETEKNLKKIFDSAEDGGAILLFDEADALFGKRSDVKDSHDRYSNIEVSYLLQRMESYRGLAILTTNMKNALDKAFMRRIRFVVNFPFPDTAQRADIWQKVFPASMPKKDIDYDRLSKLTVPGGNIRNIAMNAAFSAADEDEPVQMTHILRAVKTEYNKMEKPLNNLEVKAWQ